MAGTTWSKFYWADWRSEPTLRICSMAARGFWMELLCIAAEADPTGYVLVNGRVPTTTDLARMTGAPEADIECWLAELERNGTFSRDRKGRIYSRRIVKDVKKKKTAQQNGKTGGNPSLLPEREISPSDNPPDNPGLNTQEPEANSQLPEARAAPSGAAAGAVGLIRIFDDERAKAFGEGRRRPWPGGKDLPTAQRYLAEGIDAAGFQAVVAARMQAMARAGQDPPETLAYFRQAVADALVERTRPMPEGRARPSSVSDMIEAASREFRNGN